MDAEGSLQKRITSCQLHGSIRSLSIRGNGHQIYAGTSENNVYRINVGKKSYAHLLVRKHQIQKIWPSCHRTYSKHVTVVPSTISFSPMILPPCLPPAARVMSASGRLKPARS